MASILPSDDYIGGLFDGEGHVGVHLCHRGKLMACLHFCNTNQAAVKLFAKRFGCGKLTSRQPKMPNTRRVYEWRAGGKEAEEVARVLINVCLIKRPQLIAFLDLKANVADRGRTYTEEERRIRQEKLDAFEKVATRRMRGSK